jgi:hypothetical protein
MMHFIEENRINSVFIKRNNIGLLYKIMSGLRGLQDSPKKGASVEAILGIPTSYRFLHVEQSYVFLIDWKTILVLWQIFLMSVKTLYGECSKWI